jgi:hypothetical protein|tara:strand:+ start:491 stop:835 length:345 start_codon:yes stop_codon:yes gene_type:complete
MMADLITGRPNNIEDYLCTLKTGCWFGFRDITSDDEKTYANLIIHDGSVKPTEQECTDGLATLQASWDAEHDSYKSNRRKEYPSIADQLDDIYHNGIDGWKATIKVTKDKYSKG